MWSPDTVGFLFMYITHHQCHILDIPIARCALWEMDQFPSHRLASVLSNGNNYYPLISNPSRQESYTFGMIPFGKPEKRTECHDPITVAFLPTGNGPGM